MRYRLSLNKESLKAFYQEKKKSLRLKRLLQNPLFIGALFTVSLIPFFFTTLLIKSRFKKLEEGVCHFEQIKWRGKRFVQSQKNRNEFLKNYHHVDPYYLTHAVEGLIFLQREIETLKIICGHPSFQSCPAIKSRLNRLTKEENRLSFFEKERKVSSLIEEMHYQQKAPVEVSGEDMKNILSIIEGVSIAPYEAPPFRPQLIISRFDLKRETLLGREGYYLEMELIKRQPLNRG